MHRLRRHGLRRSALRRATPLLALVVTAVALTGCSTTVSMTAAPEAGSPLCAQVMVQLPSTLAGQDRRWTDAQATAAWGSPSKILFTCGLVPPGPSTLPCRTVRGVDWIIDESESPNYRVTSFGRSPAVQVYLQTGADGVSSADTLDRLSIAVATLPATGSTCTDRPSS